MRTVCFVLALACCLVALPATAAARPDPRAVNLRLSDMPTGFTLTTDERLTNAQVAKAEGMTVAQENKRGRLLSSHVSFEGSGLLGMLLVDSTVVLYATPMAARASFARSMGRGVPPGYKAMSLAPVGDDRRAFTGTTMHKGTAVTGYVAAFVRGRYVVLIITGALADVKGAAELDTFAHTVDGRIVRSK